jgi:[ribosomal protein S18]-alanine N-acetyltransferase
MQIRPATLADAPALMGLERTAVTTAHWSEQRYLDLFSSAATPRIALVIEDQSLLEGFLIARASTDEWEIENLVVAASARRRGCGTQLLGEFFRVARQHGARMLFLEVRESNLAARRLYEKCGFVETGRRRGYYLEPVEDAITYRLELRA